MLWAVIVIGGKCSVGYESPKSKTKNNNTVWSILFVNAERRGAGGGGQSLFDG